MPAINNDTFNDHFFDRAFFIGQIIISEFLGRVLAVAAINDDFVNDHFLMVCKVFLLIPYKTK